MRELLEVGLLKLRKAWLELLKARLANLDLLELGKAGLADLDL